MLRALTEKLDDLTTAKTKLLLLIGPSGSGKSRLLLELANDRHIQVVRVGSILGRQMVQIPSARRPAVAVEEVKNIAATYAHDDLVLFDNLELLFDRSLQLDPLGLLKRQAQVRRVVAAWPGDLVNGRLTYAHASHPEYQDYDLSGWVPFELNEK